MEQIVKVVSDEYDGNEDGVEWRIHYILFETDDDDGLKCFDLYDDDGRGNGTMICRGYNLIRMRSLTLRLGDFVEWKVGVPGRALNQDAERIPIGSRMV